MIFSLAIIAARSPGQCRVSKVFEDKRSGARAGHPGLSNILELFRKGEMLVVWKLDRLGRSVKQWIDFSANCTNRVFISKASPNRSTLARKNERRPSYEGPHSFRANCRYQPGDDSGALASLWTWFFFLRVATAF